MQRNAGAQTQFFRPSCARVEQNEPLSRFEFSRHKQSGAIWSLKVPPCIGPKVMMRVCFRFHESESSSVSKKRTKNI